MLVAALIAAGPGGASHRPGHDPPGQEPGGQSLELRAETPVVRYDPFATPPGGRATLEGRLRGGSAGQVVVLEQNPHPFDDSTYESTGRQATVDSAGRFRLTRVVTPVNTLFRATVRNIQLTSAIVRVSVRPRTSLRVSDRTPSRCELVRFSGTVWPGHEGRRVYVKRRGRDGTFRTVRRTTQRDVAGRPYSRYSARARVCSTGVYRVVAATRDGDHAFGISAARRLLVG